jgi:cardiolipin synthase A/B
VGPSLPEGERVPREQMAPSGKTRVRVIGDEPGTVGLLRLDQTVAGAARETLWLTDAYFAAPPSYVQALRSAAKDGVDVRLLVPGSSDVPTLQPVSRAGFRSLLDGGIRVFEWNGPMLHAKTAVSDGRWSRVGSTNLNVASWLSNYELDVVLDDPPFAQQMEDMFLEDLENSTELVLKGRRLRSSQPRPPVPRLPRRLRGSAGRAAAGALRVGNTVGAVLTARRVVEGGEKRMILLGGILLLVLGSLWAFFPRLVAVPAAVIAAWVGLALVWRAWRLRSPQRPEGERVLPAPPTTRSPTRQTGVEPGRVRG